MSAVEQGARAEEIERRVQAWVAQSAMAYDAGLADRDGLTGTLTPEEAGAMGPIGVRELDAVFKWVIINRNADSRRSLNRAAAGIDPNNAAIDALVSKGLHESGLVVEPGSIDDKRARRAVLRNLGLYLDATDSALLGHPLPDQVLGWAERGRAYEHAHAAVAPEKAHLRVSDLWDRFADSKVSGGTWNAREKISSQSTLRLWTQIEGDHPLPVYNASDVETFRDAVRALPADYFHSKHWKKIYDKDGAVAVVAAAEGLEVERTSSKTFNKHLARLNEFWKWAASAHGNALPTGTPSICEGLFVKISKSKSGRRLQRSRRRTFTDEEIGRLFASPTFLGSRSRRDWKESGIKVFRSHRYWVPLIGFLHGMRREEPLVLKVRHVRQSDDGIWFFDLMDDSLVGLLKDVGSPRMIPLHRSLLELDFLPARVFGRDPEALLFPDAHSFSRMARKGDPFGKWFLEFRRACRVGDPLLDFHAARHTTINRLLDAGVPEAHVEELCGHEGPERRSELSTYKRDRLIAVLKEAVDKVTIPLDVPSLIEAVANSDRVDRSFAWPALDDGTAIPLQRKGRAPKACTYI